MCAILKFYFILFHFYDSECIAYCCCKEYICYRMFENLSKMSHFCNNASEASYIHFQGKEKYLHFRAKIQN